MAQDQDSGIQSGSWKYRSAMDPYNATIKLDDDGDSVGSSGATTTPHTPQNVAWTYFRSFFKMKPSKFLDFLDFVVARDWLACMERVFQAISFSEEEKWSFLPR